MSARPHAAAVCTAILATTLLAKVAMLLSEPSRLLSALHPGLGIQIKTLVLLGAASEFVVLAAGAWLGRRALLAGSFILGTLFLGFHAYLAFSGVPSPCRCLGSLTQLSEWLSRNEAGIAVLLSLSLIAVSSFGLAAHSPSSNEDALWFPPLVAGGVWFGSGAFVILSAGTKSLGGDEGMELSKALLFQRDHAGFFAAWNDQSPVYSWIIAQVWDLTGFGIPSARWTTLAITTLLPVSISMALRPWGMSWAASILGPGLLFHPDCTLILGSSMMDLPAVALGASAVIPLILLGSRPNTALVLSALVASLAMVFKPTAAFGCLLLLTHLRPGAWLRYGVATAVGFFAISFASGYEIVQAAASHSYTGREAQTHTLDVFGFVMASPSFAAACFIAAAAASFYGPPKLVLGIFGITALSITVHLLHRPFWSYYAPHMAVPLLLLAGIGIVSMLKQRRAGAFGFSAILLGFTSVISASFVVWNVPSGTPIESRACYLIQKQGATVRRIVSEDAWAPLSIGVTPLPETMVIPGKRVWIGDWNPVDAAAAIRHQAPEVVVLYRSTSSYRPVQSMLRPYRHLGSYQGFEVYVLTNLPAVTLPKNDLKKLRL